MSKDLTEQLKNMDRSALEAALSAALQDQANTKKELDTTQKERKRNLNSLEILAS